MYKNFKRKEKIVSLALLLRRKHFVNYTIRNTYIMYKKILFPIFAIIIICICGACSKNDESADSMKIEAPIGEIWTTIGDIPLRFKSDASIFTEASAGYTTSIKFLSIFRAVSNEDRRSLHIRATLDLDKESTPADIMQNVKITYTTFLNGQKSYNGLGTAIKFRLVDKTNDIVKATFSGTLTNQANPNDKIEIKGGSVNIKVKRF